jgi:Ca2+-binding EF-hand superfamily protein
MAESTVPVDKESCDALFDRMDSGDGLSLVEIDKAITELYPSYDHKPALMRAYKAADRSEGGFIQRAEFRRVLHYLVFFHNMWHKFEEIDPDGDRRLDLAEFASGCRNVGIDVGEAEVATEFARVDVDNHGVVLFGEFCTWCARRWHLGGNGGVTDEKEAQPRVLSMDPGRQSLTASTLAGLALLCS